MSALKLVAPSPDHAPLPAIGDYLDRLGARLRVGDTRRAEVLIEIEDHVRDRARDLMVNGLGEREALAKAIDELPEPAALAARLTAAIKRPQRRRIMNMAIFGVGGVAILSALTVLNRPGGQQGVSIYTPPAAQSAAGTAQIGAQRNATWDGFFAAAGKAAIMPVFVHWAPLAEIDNNIHPGAGLKVELNEGFSLDRALSLVNESLNLREDHGVAYRVEDGILAFASTAYFDRRDEVLTSFDLSDLAVSPAGEPLDAVEREALMERVVLLITNLVHDDLWESNGGDRASLRVFGAKLFVKAPKRILPEVEWVLQEIRSGKQVSSTGRSVPVLSDIPIVAYQRSVPSDHAISDNRTFPLGHTDCTSVSDFLAEAVKVSPLLSADTDLKIVASPQQNAVNVVGSSQAITTVESLIALIDRPAPESLAGGNESRTTTLQHIRPGAMRALLGRAFNTSPAMKQCSIERVLESDDSTNRIVITATPDQVAWAGNLIEALDSGPAISR